MAYQQNKDLRTLSEFTVDVDKVPLIDKFKEKIERMYEVGVEFDCVTELDADMKKSKQWVSVEGENIDRRNAKEYILALCHPKEKQVFEIDDEYLDDDTLEQIEKQTNAVLLQLDKTMIEITGTEVGVVLAMSSLEDIIQKQRNGIDIDGLPKELDDIKNRSDHEDFGQSHWSRQLDTSLHRALSQHSDNNYSVEDYNSASTSVKQVILHCLSTKYNNEDDVDESELFAGQSDVVDSAGSSHKQYKVPIFIDGQPINRSPIEEEKMDALESSSQTNVLSLSDKFNQAIISPEKCVRKQRKIMKDNPDQQYLRQFGLSVGYSVDEVEEGLEFVDEKTKPADFLELLSEIKANRESPSLEVQEEGCDIVGSSKFPPPPRIDDINLKELNTRRSLPQEYKQRLIKDFNEENEHLPVEELKRRNEERQKMLKEAYENSGKKQGQSSEQGNPGGKKGKKRKNKNREPMNSPVGKNQPKQNQGEKQNQKKGKKKQNQASKNILENKVDDDDDDEEQTCVLKMWEDNIEDDMEFKDDECKIVGFDSPRVPVYIQPQTKSSQCQQVTPQQQIQQPWQQPRWQQQSPTWQQQQSPSKHQRQQQNSQQHWRAPQQNRQDRGTKSAPLMELKTNPPGNAVGKEELRYVVVDGSNVAMAHGNGKCFSCKGIKIVIEYFIQRGHKNVMAFVPEWRKYRPRFENPISDQNILTDLKESGHLAFTPSRRINGKLISSYDDRFVLELAEREDGVIVSNDQYRDLLQEKASWRKIIEERLLMYSFVGDNFMPPFDPLGRDGPCLDVFLRRTPKQPQRKRHLSPNEGAQDTPNTWKNRGPGGSGGNQRWPRPQQNFNNPPQNNYPVGFHPVNVPPPNYPYHQQQARGSNSNTDVTDSTNQGNKNQKTNKSLSLRSDQKTNELLEKLKIIFSEPDQEKKIQDILQNHPSETNIEKLTNFCINAFC